MSLFELHESAPHADWKGYEIHCSARVELHHGWKPPRYLMEGCLDFGDVGRTQWNVHAVVATQAEAERLARLWWSVALPLWRQSLETKTAPETPGDRRARACAAHVASLPDVVKARASVAAIRTRSDAHGFADGWQVLRHEMETARQMMIGAEQRDEAAFYAAHSWVEYIEAPPVPVERGQFALFGAA